MEENEHGNENTENGRPTKRPSKVRDLFTDRVRGIVIGAIVPVVILIIPLIKQYLDNSKEIQTLQIKDNAEDIENTKRSVEVLTRVIVGGQVQLQSLTDKLGACLNESKVCTDSLIECKKKPR